MRRVARRLFALCLVVSLLLCGIACVLWVRSYFVSDDLTWRGRGAVGALPADVESRVGIGRGGFMFEQVRTRRDLLAAVPPSTDLRWWKVVPPYSVGGGRHLKSFWRRRGFDYQTTGPMTKPGRVEQFDLFFPLWFAALSAALLSGASRWGWRIARRRERSHLGLCPACGYDLRASLERCPECGASEGQVTAPPDANA